LGFVRRRENNLGSKNFLTMKKCVRCTICIGKEYTVKEYKKKKFMGKTYIMCPECYEEVKSAQAIKDLPEIDRKEIRWWKKV